MIGGLNHQSPNPMMINQSLIVPLKEKRKSPAPETPIDDEIEVDVKEMHELNDSLDAIISGKNKRASLDTQFVDSKPVSKLGHHTQISAYVKKSGVRKSNLAGAMQVMAQKTGFQNLNLVV